MTCSYCYGVRLVGWSGAGPILCPTCSDGHDPFHVITLAWREQRARVVLLDAESERLRSPRPLDDWHEDDGSVLWWRFPIVEPPYCGTPLDDDFPGNVTHWTPILVPEEP